MSTFRVNYQFFSVFSYGLTKTYSLQLAAVYSYYYG